MNRIWNIACVLIGIVLILPLDSSADDEFPTFEELPKQTDLPDPFLMLDGSKVLTKADWFEKRRPELKRLFLHYMYGVIPGAPKVTSKVTSDTTVLNGKARLRQITIAFPELPDNAPKIHLAVFTPKTTTKPVPVFLAINKCGNHTVIANEAIEIVERGWQHSGCKKPDFKPRGSKTDFWCTEYLIGRGYGFATFQGTDIDPDRHDFTDGIHPFYPNLPGPKESHWGTISAWAWGLMRCVDVLEKDDLVDKSKIAVIGHSRRGKTALLAGAIDERFALVVPHQSGTGGMALSRNNDQETVERINRVFPHWFSDSFVPFGIDNEDKLPFDQHLLIAMVAPRPLMETSGLKDTWANYESSINAIRAADAVYRFVGETGVIGTGILTAGDKINHQSAGNLLQYRLDTKHTLNQDYWRGILDFADMHFHEKN